MFKLLATVATLVALCSPAVANNVHAKAAVYITIYGKYCNQSVPTKVTEMIDVYMQTHSQEFLSAEQEIGAKFRWLRVDAAMTNKWCDFMKPQLTKILDQLDADGRKLEGR